MKKERKKGYVKDKKEKLKERLNSLIVLDMFGITCNITFQAVAMDPTDIF
jgi:hypothetical protein